MSRAFSCCKSAASCLARSVSVAAKPRLPASAVSFFASPSALPVWLPKSTRKVFFGAAKTGVAAPLAAEASENKPARKPLSHWRCSSEKGALSGMNGTRGGV